MQEDWECIGKFLGKARQKRRAFIKTCQRLVEEIAAQSFANQRREWRRQGKFVYRHGVFFDSPGRFACPCLGQFTEDELAWVDAKRMPALDHQLKCMVAVPFEPGSFRRLGQVQADARRMDW